LLGQVLGMDVDLEFVALHGCDFDLSPKTPWQG